MSEIRLPRPEPSAEFRARLRAELVREARALADARSSRPTFADRVRSLWSAPALRPALAAATVVAVLLTGTGAAAAGSLPGDAAYPLKRAFEEVELLIAPTPEARVEVLTRQSQRRLDDLGKAASRSDRAPTASSEYEAAVERLATAVAELRAAPPGEKREAVERVVEAARDKHVEVLEQLRERVPESAQRGIDRAIEQQKRIPSPENDPARDADKEKDKNKDDRGGRPSQSPRGGRPSPAPSGR